MRRHILSLIAAALLLCGMSLTVFAQDVPDRIESGTIELTVAPGAEVTIYRAGDIQEDDGNYSFALTGKFAESGLALEDVRSPELGAALAKYAEGGVSQTADENGKVIFAVERGLYLLVQTKAGEGDYLFNPFLISMPNWENGAYNDKVDATPKVGPPAETTKPTEPPVTKPPEEELPQTGQLNWPVPLLAVSGLALFVLGWMLRFKERKENYEK